MLYWCSLAVVRGIQYVAQSFFILIHVELTVVTWCDTVHMDSHFK